MVLELSNVSHSLLQGPCLIVLLCSLLNIQQMVILATRRPAMANSAGLVSKVHCLSLCLDLFTVPSVSVFTGYAYVCLFCLSLNSSISLVTGASCITGWLAAHFAGDGSIEPNDGYGLFARGI